MVAIVAVGFWPSYFGLLMGTGGDKELFIHVHAIVYVSWMALFVTQTALIAAQRVVLHQKLGQFGMVWGIIVLVIGIATALLRFGTMTEAGMAEEAQRFIIWPLLDMVIFAAFLIPAIAYRRRPAIHKRFMFVATTNLLVAAVARSLGLDTPMAHMAFITLWLSPILIVVVHDLVNERIVHPIYAIGAIVLTVSTFRDAVTTTDTWLAFTQWLASVST